MRFSRYAVVAFTSIGALCSHNALANQDAVKLPRPTGEPLATVGVYDITTSPATIVQNATVSKANANHRLCWRIENVTPNFDYSVTEHIYSPAAASFIDKDGKNGRSPSGRYHRITRTLTTDGDGAFQKCWQFGDTDPNGEYEVQVEVGDLQFPVRYFYVAD